MRMRVCFLFNHDQIHQVAHSLPIAMALARANTGATIILATTNSRIQAEVIQIAGAYLRDGVVLEPLSLRRSQSRAIVALSDWVAPAQKLMIYGDNLEFFQSLDVLVVAEKTSLVLKTHYGLSRPKIIHTRHGAGDRAIGFDPSSAGFDHMLVAGPKVRDRLVADAGADPSRISIVGYPKFDLDDGDALNLLARDERPIVLYNPHVSPHLSSWYRQGRRVLDWFVEHDEYQLIFAPHVMLYERKIAASIDKLRFHRPGQIEPRYLRASNIHIDLGSRESTTMRYTNLADIYLGDVSSQVYEFLRQPRPCLFLNAHRVDWQGDPNYAHWSAGPVIEDCDELGAGLRQARRDHQQVYRPVQEALFRYSIDLTSTPSSVRAAREVARIAGLTWPIGDQWDTNTQHDQYSIGEYGFAS